MRNNARSAFSAIVFLFATATAFAENSDNKKCGEAIDLLKQYATIHDPFHTSFTFQKDENAVVILLLFGPAGGKVDKWALLVKPPNELTRYCVASEGETIERLEPPAFGSTRIQHS